MAVRLAFDRMPSDGLDEFESLFESLLSDADDGDAYEMAEIDRAFHGMILEASGNRWLKELAGLLLDKSRLIRTISLRYPGQMKNSWQEHIELIRAVRAGDRTTAESLALKHVTNARDAVLRAIDGEF
jgi:DNA-binding GntR family transcriptional regulator